MDEKIDPTPGTFKLREGALVCPGQRFFFPSDSVALATNLRNRLFPRLRALSKRVFVALLHLGDLRFLVRERRL